MLHDTVMARALMHGQEAGAGIACDDRRRADRLPFPCEMILLWNHDASLRHRHRVIDASDGGYRICSTLPLLPGTTGMVLRLLPCGGHDKAQPVMVVWCRKAAGDGNDGDAGGARGEGDRGYEVGLRIF